MTSLKHVDHWHRKSFILLVAAILLLWPVMGLALTECFYIQNVADHCNGLDVNSLNVVTNGSGDCDSDGYTDRQECEGFYTNNGSGPRIYGYSETTSLNANVIKLNPAEPDLMFLATNSLGAELTQGLMYDALQSAKGKNALSLYADSLRVHAHQVTTAYLDALDPNNSRLITATTRAAKIVEFTADSSSGADLGWTKVSAPTDPETVSKIYTKRIQEDVKANCTDKALCCTVWADRKTVLVPNSLCTPGSAADNKAVLNYYILQVIAHEMGHGSTLAATGPTNDYHYRGSSTVMDPAVIVKTGKYTIPIQFNLSLDKPALTLHDPAYVPTN